jgi:hypothetical protein
MVPDAVMSEYRERETSLEGKLTNRVAAVVIVVIWLSLADAAIHWLS